MAKQYLDKTGLVTLWERIKTLFVAKREGYDLISNENLTKLNNIQEGANNYTLPPADGTNLGGIKQGGVAVVVNGEITEVTGAKIAEKVSNKLTIKNGETVITEFDGSGMKNLQIEAQGSTSIVAEENKIIVAGAAIPEKLANPQALTIKLNSGNVIYDGSTAKEVALDASDLGIANVLTFRGPVEELPASAANGDVYIKGGNEYAYYEGEWIELGNSDDHALKTIKVNAGSGLTGGGSLISDLTISHAAKAATLNDVAAASRTYVNAIAFDEFGHVKSVSTAAETVVDTGATAVEVTGAGNAITGASYDATNRKITLTKEASYNNFTYSHDEHHPAGNAANKALKMYKIATDAKSHVSQVEEVTSTDLDNLIGSISESEIDAICVL